MDLLCANDTGDDERINAALAGNGEVVLAGTCLIDGPIRLEGDRTLRGESRTSAVIRQAPGANLDAMLASDTYLDNWVGGAGTDGIALDNTAGWLIRGNHVYDVGRVSLWAERLFSSSITDNYLEDFVESGLRLSVQGGAASTVSGNRVFDFSEGTPGTFLETRVNYGTGNLAVTGNTLRGNGTGVGLDYQHGQGEALATTSTGNLVTEIPPPSRPAPGVTVSAGIQPRESRVQPPRVSRSDPPSCGFRHTRAATKPQLAGAERETRGGPERDSRGVRVPGGRSSVAGTGS